MKTIAVIFGGKSVEHDISIITGTQAIKSAELIYNVVPIYITKQGKWLTGKKLCDIKNFENFDEKRCNECFFLPNNQSLQIKQVFGVKKIKIDACLVCLHGQNGEDGCLQGFLKIVNIPFSGCDVCSSAVTFDKVICKNLLIANGVPTLGFISFFDTEYIKDEKTILDAIVKLKFPVIVKPARCGSSVGITKCKNKTELKKAIEFALHFDFKIIVEKALIEFDEINVAVMKDEDGVKCSAIEKIETNGNIFTFDDKYINGNIKHDVDIKLNSEIENAIFDTAVKAYRCCDCSSIVRVDLMVLKNGTVFVNEINAIPGSLSFYLWKKKGFGFTGLINKLIVNAISNHKKNQELNHVLNTKAVVEFKRVQQGKMHK